MSANKLCILMDILSRYNYCNKIIIIKFKQTNN